MSKIEQPWGPVARPVHAYLLLLCGCMSVLAAVVIAPILPKMQAHFIFVDNADFLVPLTLTTPGLVIAIMSLFVGAFADRFGRKRLLVGALALYGIFGCAPLLLDSLPEIIATRIGVGFSEAVIMTCCTALIGDYFKGIQRERYLALNTTFASTSAVIFLVAGGALGEFGWRTPFSIYSISMLLALVCWVLLWEPRNHSTVVKATAADDEEESVWSVSRLIGICFVTLIGGIAFMAVQVHIAYLLRNVGVISPGTVGLIASGAQVAVVVGSLAFRSILRAGFRTPIRIGIAFVIVAVGYLLVGTGSSVTEVTLGALITGFGCGILLPTLQVWNMNTLPHNRRALGTGAWMAAFFLGQFLTPIVVVGLGKEVGGIAIALRDIGFVMLPCAALLIFITQLLKPRQYKSRESGDQLGKPEVRPVIAK